jgi:hypothetical protein
LRGRRAIERAVDAIRVIVIPEFLQLPRQVDGVPEQYAIETQAPDRPNQPFDERMRDRSVRNRLDLLDPEDRVSWARSWGGLGRRTTALPRLTAISKIHPPGLE